MTHPVNKDLALILEHHTDAELIRYAEAYYGLDGRELVIELTIRLRKCKREVFEREHSND